MRNAARGRRRDKHGPVLLAVSLFTIAILAGAFIRHDVVGKNVYAFGVSLGGLPREEAETLLREKSREVESVALIFMAGSRSTTVSREDLRVLLDDDRLVDSLADSVSSRSRLMPSFFARLGAKIVLAAPAQVVSPDAEQTLARIAAELSYDALGTRYEFGGRNLEVVEPTDGQTVTPDDVRRALQTVSSRTIEVPFTTVPAPAATELPGLVLTGEFSTPYDTLDTDRNVNLALAAATFHAKVLRPGETYSFNKTAGERTAEKGYRYANIVVGDHLEPGLAGGICQVTTTLFNAAAEAGLDFPELHAHGIPVEYVPPGTDAAVEWGYLDLKIRNNTDLPVVLGAWVEDGEVSARVFGASPDKIYELLPVTIETYPAEGKEPGLLVETWRVEKSLAGEEIGRKMLVRSYYLPHVKVKAQ